MTTTDGFVIGVLATLVAVSVFYGAYRAVRALLELLVSLKTGLDEIPKMRVASENLVQVLSNITGQGGTAADAGGSFGEPTYTPASYGVRSSSPFPEPVLSRFPQEPYAEPEGETSPEVSASDAELAEIEKLENLRQAGYHMEEPPEGTGIGASI
jgi:hypothetical protein